MMQGYSKVTQNKNVI